MKEAQGDRKIRHVAPWPSISKVLTRDGGILFTTRIARLFAYGFLSVILVLYLAQAGLSETEIGLLLTLTLGLADDECWSWVPA